MVEGTQDSPDKSTKQVLTPKRKLNKSKWKRNVREVAHQSGKSHNNSKNELVEERKPRALEAKHEICRFKCENLFDEGKRKQICREYCALEDYAR